MQLGSRFKPRSRSNVWKCCFCWHVRTGTIFFGFWHLMLHLFALSVMILVLKHPELMTFDDDMTSDIMKPAPTPLMELETRQELKAGYQFPNKHIATHSTEDEMRAIYYRDVNSYVIFTFCTFMITLLMVYGAIKNNPIYLLPFFCLQVFDFGITSLSVLGFILYMPDLHALVQHFPRTPYQRELLSLNERYLAALVTLTFIVALVVKAYFLCLVWSCYKYLTLRALNVRTIHYIDTESLLPSYEAAVKTYPTPPPSYDTATRNNPPPPQTTPVVACTSASAGGDVPPPQPM